MEMNVEKTKISGKPSPAQIILYQKQLEYVEYFNYFGTLTTNDARCTSETKSRIAMTKAAFNKKRTLFHQEVGINLRKKLVKCCIWRIVLYGAATLTLL